MTPITFGSPEAKAILEQDRQLCKCETTELHTYIVETETTLIRHYHVQASSDDEAREIFETDGGTLVLEDEDGEEIVCIWRE